MVISAIICAAISAIISAVLSATIPLSSLPPRATNPVMQPLLLPTPRRCEIRPGRAAADAPIRLIEDRSLPPQGYRLEIDPHEVRLAHADASGRRHGEATLAQLPDRPCLRIDDAPAFAVRGVMLDVSRDRVPTLEELLRLVDQLAAWKVNHLQLYVEHVFAYRGHREVWEPWSPLTHEDIATLAARCAARGIDLAANQNCLGHLARWFRLPAYAAMAEMAPGEPWDFNGLAAMKGPFSLCPSDPRSLPFVRGLLEEMLPCFPSRLANIGCDEAFDLGQGRSREVVARRGRAAVYLEWVREVAGIVRGLGKQPQFWADIALEDPESLGELPEDLVALCWGYEPDAPFARWVEQVRGVGRSPWVCPGTSCWRTWTARTTERRENLLAAAREDADGFLATAWGDLGHRQPWPVTLHGLAEAAHRAWSGTAPFDPRSSGRFAFGAEALGAWLDELGDADRSLRVLARRRNASELFVDMHRPWAEPAPGDAAAYEEVGGTLDRLAGSMPAGDSLVEEELRSGLAFASLAARRGAIRRATPADHAARRALARPLREAIDARRSLWTRRARPGGLESSLAHDLAVLADLEA